MRTSIYTTFASKCTRTHKGQRTEGQDYNKGIGTRTLTPAVPTGGFFLYPPMCQRSDQRVVTLPPG